MEPCCAVFFLGAPWCITPSADVQSASRFTPLDHHGSQVYQKENHQRLLLWEVSVVQQRLITPEFNDLVFHDLLLQQSGLRIAVATFSTTAELILRRWKHFEIFEISINNFKT